MKVAIGVSRVSRDLKVQGFDQGLDLRVEGSGQGLDLRVKGSGKGLDLSCTMP